MCLRLQFSPPSNISDFQPSQGDKVDVMQEKVETSKKKELEPLLAKPKAYTQQRQSPTPPRFLRLGSVSSFVRESARKEKSKRQQLFPRELCQERRRGGRGGEALPALLSKTSKMERREKVASFRLPLLPRSTSLSSCTYVSSFPPPYS